MKAKIVVGLGWGDEGKGISTDFLCSQAEEPIVIRFSGGQQAGHTVKHQDKEHVFANFGSGTLRGVPTYITEHCCIYPITISKEKSILESMDVNPNMFVHPLAKVTTPYDVAWNQLLELRNDHGSCGLGVGTTMKRSIETPYKLFAKDLMFPKVARERVQAVRQFYYGKALELNLHNKFKELVEEKEEVFFEKIREDLFEIKDYSYLYNFQEHIFEGSQGILLDMDHGFFPNVTYAHTTSKNAIQVCKTLDLEYEVYYVTRCYQTRHGNGYMSNEEEIELINNEGETNKHNPYQGSFRVGEVDYSL